MSVLSRLLGLLCAITLVAGCSQPPQEVTSRAVSYTNPVYVGGQDGLREAPDSGPLKYNGEYYTYVTGDPCLVLKSTDLVNWSLVGKMIDEVSNCWAPVVTYWNGTFYAYISNIREGMGEYSRRVRLYTADRPEGPFHYQSDLTEQYSYDPGYFRDQDGTAYLYWTQECVSLREVDPCRGNAVVADRLVAMDRLAGQPTRVIVAQMGEWECRTSRCLLEAPEVLARDGRYFMHYSGAAWENASYSGGSAVSAVPVGPGGYQDESWVKGPKVLGSIEGKVDGPGGGAWVMGPTNLEEWLIYHGRGITRETLDRWLRIDPIMWGRERYWIAGAPSYTEQPGPAQPRFRDLFDRPDILGLGREWSTQGGKWSVVSGEAQQTEAVGPGRALQPVAAQHYVFEANLRWLPGSVGGRAGVIAYWADEHDYLLARLDREAARLEITPVVSGMAQPVTGIALPSDFDFEVYHQLMVRKNGDHFDLLLDGLPVSAVTQAWTRPGRTGLVTDGAAVAFDGVAFAEGWADFFPEGGDLTWGEAEGAGRAGSGKPEVTPQWLLRDGLLAQESVRGESSLFKGSRQWASYEFTANLRQTGGEGEVGLYASYVDPQNYLAVVLKPGGLESWAVMKGKPTEPVRVDLAGLQPADWQALRITKNGFTFRFYLSGDLVHEAEASLSRGQPGLVTRDAAGEFDSIRAVRWD